MSWPTLVCASSYSIAALLVAKLTPADVTPPAPVSASCTVAAQLAQVMPSMGRTIRALLMRPPRPPAPPPPGAVELVRRRSGSAVASWFDDEEALQHVHATAEGVFARLIGRELDRGGLKRRQGRVDPESLEHHTLRAGGGLVPIELQPHGLCGLHDDRIGRVAAFYGDSHFLNAFGPRRCCHRLAARKKEVPQHPDDGSGAERRDDDLGGRR